MSARFNLTDSTKVSGIDFEGLEHLLRLLEYHVRFDGSDIEKVDYDPEGVLHIFPSENPACVLSKEGIQVHSRGDDAEHRLLTVTPFLEDYCKRTFLSLRIDLHGNQYVIHRIDKAHY